MNKLFLKSKIKITATAVFIALNTSALLGQIENSGFETQNDTIATLPSVWGFKSIEGYKVFTDSNIKYKGQKSLKLECTDGSIKKFMGFSQVVEIDVPKLKKIAITVYIKTEGIVRYANVWCQIWDKNNEMIGFNSLQEQHVVIDKTNDWKKYSLEMILNTNCKKLCFGGILSGKGTVWFDQFSLEEVNTISAPPSKKVKKYIDEFCKIIKENSIVSDSLNWPEIEQEIEFFSQNLKKIDDAEPVLNHIMNKLKEKGDFHSFLMSTDYLKPASKSSKTTSPSETSPQSEILPGNIGYISVPGFLGDSFSCDNFANKIQQLIKQMDTENDIKGWIVDLRKNTGGNMYPMITGLSPLLKNGVIGYFVIPKDGTKQKWEILNGAINIQGNLLMKVNEPYLLKKQDLKIAVLIGPSTASSGEMTAISFIGNPNTKLFGQPSAGYTTANRSFPISKKLVFNLAASFVSDRNGKEYFHAISPEVTVTDDDILKVASQWLLEIK